MRCIGYSRHGVNHPQVESVTLPELLAQSDVLSLHCPLTQETRRLLDRSALARMKQGSILINTARGAIVDCDALADALESGHLRGAGLDVYPDEPRTVKPSTLSRSPTTFSELYSGIYGTSSAKICCSSS